MDWLDLLAVQGTHKSLLQHYTSKASILQHSAFFIVQLSHPYMTTEKNVALIRWTFVGEIMRNLTAVENSSKKDKEEETEIFTKEGSEWIWMHTSLFFVIKSFSPPSLEPLCTTCWLYLDCCIFSEYNHMTRCWRLLLHHSQLSKCSLYLRWNFSSSQSKTILSFSALLSNILKFIL